MKHIKSYKEVVNESIFGTPEDKQHWLELKEGDNIRALKDLNGYGNAYSMPSRMDIKEGAVLQVEFSTNRGDVFCHLIDGEVIENNRGEKTIINKDNNTYKQGNTIFHHRIGLDGGFKSRYPRDYGIVDPECWEIL